MDHGRRHRGAINNFSGPAEPQLPWLPSTEGSGWGLGALGSGLSPCLTSTQHQGSLAKLQRFPSEGLFRLPGVNTLPSNPLSRSVAHPQFL